MNGIVIIDKEKGYTSRDIVNIASKVFQTKKVGHTGTLDPIATGVLVLVVGRATKLVDFLTATTKEYIATICLGTTTDTLDNTGVIENEEIVSVTEEKIDRVLESMIGSYEQEVPKYAAVKVNGKKLYEYARNKEEVILPKRAVDIYELKRVSAITEKEGKIYFDIQTKVSKGTYIRSLIRDIALKLNTVGMMCELRRIKQGDFMIEEANSIEALKEKNVSIIPIKDVLKNIKSVMVNEKLEKKIKNGCLLTNTFGQSPILFLSKFGDVLAIYQEYEQDSNLIKPKIMF